MRYRHHAIVDLLRAKRDELDGDKEKQYGGGNGEFVFLEGGEVQKTYSINEQEQSLLAAEAAKEGDEVMTSSTRQLLFAASNGDIAEITRLIKKGSDPTLGDYDDRYSPSPSPVTIT